MGSKLQLFFLFSGIGYKMARRITAFLILCALTIVLFFIPLRALLSLALRDDAYSYILLTPFISAFFVFLARKSIFAGARYSMAKGAIIIGAGIVLRFLPALPGSEFLANAPGTWMMASLLVFFIGGCIALFGMQAIWKARFPLVFLVVFGIPLPEPVLNACVTALQWGSAAVADAILTATGATYARDGLCFYFPSISIVIATECSGIRSSSALIITSVVAARLFLSTRPGRIALIMISLPLAMTKNGIRVATLALLGERVNPHFITHSRLHHQGGFVFFGIALALLIACMLIIERMERARTAKGRTSGQADGSVTE
jgi:exosortase